MCPLRSAAPRLVPPGPASRHQTEDGARESRATGRGEFGFADGRGTRWTGRPRNVTCRTRAYRRSASRESWRNGRATPALDGASPASPLAPASRMARITTVSSWSSRVCAVAIVAPGEHAVRKKDHRGGSPLGFSRPGKGRASDPQLRTGGALLPTLPATQPPSECGPVP